MFASDYLKAYEDGGPHDWECVFDMACGYDPLLCRGYDITAYWSPSRSLVAFGNAWGDVPDMPIGVKPEEWQLEEWVKLHPGWLERWRNAARARKEAREAKFKGIDKVFDTYGSGNVYVKFVAPDGSVREIAEPCGVHGPLYMLRVAVSWMTRHMPVGTKINKLTVTRRKPMHRGEKKAA